MTFDLPPCFVYCVTHSNYCPVINWSVSLLWPDIVTVYITISPLNYTRVVIWQHMHPLITRWLAISPRIFSSIWLSHYNGRVQRGKTRSVGHRVSPASIYVSRCWCITMEAGLSQDIVDEFDTQGYIKGTRKHSAPLHSSCKLMACSS